MGDNWELWINNRKDKIGTEKEVYKAAADHRRYNKDDLIEIYDDNGKYIENFK